MHRRTTARISLTLAVTLGVAAPAAAQSSARPTTWSGWEQVRGVEPTGRSATHGAPEETSTATDEPEPPTRLSPFEREFGVAFYGTGHAGSYLAGGIGGRLRWEPFEYFGVEAYLEATLVDWPGSGFRHDYPNGFNVYIPVRVDDFRIRPYLGFCDVLSFVEPEQDGAPRADDVMFGLHGGLGAEVALGSYFTLVADLQANVYLGHDRTSEGWTGGVDEDFSVFWNMQLNLGASAHFGQR